jgi:hypothetical protein
MRGSGHGAYGGGVCCGYRWAIIAPGPYEDAVRNGTVDILRAANNCSAEYVDVTGDGYNWHSHNTSVAGVASAYTSLAGAGSATANPYPVYPAALSIWPQSRKLSRVTEWRHSATVSTAGFQSANPGSIPGGATIPPVAWLFPPS